MAACGAADAILLGAVGGPKWSDPGAAVRPEQALFALRGGLGLYANLRPVTRPSGARRRRRRSGPSCSTGVDLLIVRELTGGIYFGDRDGAVGPSRRARRALDTLPYAEHEIARIVAARVRAGPRPARPRDARRQGERARDVAAVAHGRRRGRGRATRTSSSSHQLVDSCAMLLVRRPADFDVIVTENLFGDILSDEAAVLAGIARRCCRRRRSGSAGPRTARSGCTSRSTARRRTSPARTCANPIGTILSAAMLLRTVARARGRGRGDRGGRRRGARRRLADRRPGRCRRRSRRARRRRHDRRSRPPWSRRSRPARRRGRDRRAIGAATDAPVVLYDTTLRDGTQGENITLSLADKLRIARMLDEYGMPFIEGGWPGSNPKDIEFFAAARTMRWETREAGRVRLDPPPLEQARATTRTCASWSPPRRRS